MTAPSSLGIVDTPVDSLFTYQPGESWATFYDPFYVPTYQPMFANPELESQANDLCGDDIFCLFDVAATGSMDIGLSTLEGGREIKEIAQLQIPGLLVTIMYTWKSCMGFAMMILCMLLYLQLFVILHVATECVLQMILATALLVMRELTALSKVLCKCSLTVHAGTRLVQSLFLYVVFSQCEENPCQNGGTCVRHVLDYSCQCPPTTSGDFCETGILSMSH